MWHSINVTDPVPALSPCSRCPLTSWDSILTDSILTLYRWAQSTLSSSQPSMTTKKDPRRVDSWKRWVHEHCHGAPWCCQAW